MTGRSEARRQLGVVAGKGVFVEVGTRRYPIHRMHHENPVPADGTEVSFIELHICSEDRADDVREVHAKSAECVPPSSETRAA